MFGITKLAAHAAILTSGKANATIFKPHSCKRNATSAANTE